jgi:hypothetical protein
MSLNVSQKLGTQDKITMLQHCLFQYVFIALGSKAFIGAGIRVIKIQSAKGEG